MKLRIHVEGLGFDKGADLESTLDLLSGHAIGFKQCLKLASKRHKIKSLQYPQQRLISVQSGSLDVSLFTDIASAVAPVAPQLFGYGWQLYKSAYDLIGIVSRYFKAKEKPMNITISNSPGATVNIVNGDQVQVNKDVLETAKTIHPALDRIASLISKRRAKKITIDADIQDNAPQISFTKNNQEDFKLPYMDTTDPDPVQFQCSIYRFNKRTCKGWLEHEEDDQVVIKFPFSAEPRMLGDCLNGFSRTSVWVTAYRKMEVNALGETKIKEYHLVDISYLEDDD